jgi:two-component system cell cycle sensor histidine kinase PleC
MPEFLTRPASSGPDKARAPDFEQRLKSLQLTLSTDALRDIAVTVPAWAGLMCILFAGYIPALGTTSIYLSWPWPFFCLAMTCAILVLHQHVKETAEDDELDGPHWVQVIASGHFIVAGSWCLVTLVFWEPLNAANHCLLLAVSIAASSLFLTSRSGQFVMVACATVPNLGMIWLHLVSGELWLDQVLAWVLVIWAGQLHYEAWRSCRMITAAHRTRFEMENLASELSKARDEAASANRAKSVFLANMSHELRTPLNAILGFAEIISTKALGKASQERQREYLDHILQSGRHLLHLINDVLDIAKMDAGKLMLERRWIDGAAVLKDCINAVAEQAQAGGLTMTSSATPEDLKLHVDERAFRQIVANLLSNAIKFTPHGGRIAARLTQVDDGVVLSIRDTGCGIPANELASVFKPFEQVGSKYGRASGGSGLGLTLVRSLTDLHGGNCRIDSEVDMGTLVTVFLPQPSPSAAEDARKIA